MLLLTLVTENIVKEWFGAISDGPPREKQRGCKKRGHGLMSPNKKQRLGGLLGQGAANLGVVRRTRPLQMSKRGRNRIRQLSRQN